MDLVLPKTIKAIFIKFYFKIIGIKFTDRINIKKMKKHFIKVAGILNSISITAALGLIIYAFFDSRDDEKIFIILFLIPLYFFIHFIIFYKFGFSESSHDEKTSKLLRVSSFFLMISIFITSIIVTISFFYEKVNKNKVEKQFGEIKKWPNDTTAYGIIANLETKYKNDHIQYQLNITTDSTNQNRLNDISSYTIRFMDNDGFVIDNIDISEFINTTSDDGVVIGHNINSSSYIDIFKYSRFHSWDLIITSNKN